jgi:hypothetical protein
MSANPGDRALSAAVSLSDRPGYLAWLSLCAPQRGGTAGPWREISTEPRKGATHGRKS